MNAASIDIESIIYNVYEFFEEEYKKRCKIEGNSVLKRTSKATTLSEKIVRSIVQRKRRKVSTEESNCHRRPRHRRRVPIEYVDYIRFSLRKIHDSGMEPSLNCILTELQSIEPFLIWKFYGR